MVRDFIARCFRAINAGLIDTENPLWFKALKVAHRVSRWWYLYSRYPQGREVVIHNFDKNIALRLDPSKPIGGGLYWTGFHEFRELLFLHRYLNRDMVLVDVGANLGEFTLFAAKRLTQGRVISYEPLPAMAANLTKNVALNSFKNISIVEAGLAEANKRLPLFLPASADNNEGLATLFPEKGTTKFVEIELRTLDDEVDRLGLKRLDVITIDIEGSELRALQGGKRTLQKFKPLIITEINAKTFGAAGYTVEDLQTFLKDMGYESRAIGKRGELNPIGMLPQFGNVVFNPAP